MPTTLLEGTSFDYPLDADSPGVPARRNGRSLIELDEGDAIDIVGIVPSAYAAGTLDLILKCATDEVSGDIDVQAEVEKMDGLDLDTDSFDTANASDNNTSPATAGQEFDITITLTNDDSLAAGHSFRIRVTFKTSSGATNPLQIVAWELQEQ